MSSQFDISKAADQCVMCGMCLPHCPTYQVSQHEAESPRGRISLIKAFAEGQLTASDSLETHIQSCTGCLKCQQICPAKVNYQEIIDTGKQIYRSRQSYRSRLVQNIAIQASTSHRGHKLVRFVSRIVKKVPNSGRFIQLLKYVESNPANYSMRNQHTSSVNVFTGCTGSLYDQQTLNSLITLLDTIGIEAKAPKTILCCGALSQHSGLPEKAARNIKNLKDYLGKQSSSILLSIASGCGRQLNEQLPTDSIQHYDALHWLSSQNAFQDIQYTATSQKVLLHTPCTVSTAEQKRSYEILNKIPNIELIEFNDALACCGAGGLQLTSPETSNQRLLKEKINTIQTVKPDVIVSSNVGCALNFKLGLDEADLDIEVIHPLTLLARQLDV